MAMAWRLPTLLATPGNLHHHDSETLSFQASLSWCRTLAPDHLFPSSSSSTSAATHSSPPFNRDQYVAFHEMCGQAGAGPVNLARGTPVKPSSIVVFVGRQIVRRAVDEGYVRCLVRPRPTPVNFLRDWHATVVSIGKEKLLLYNVQKQWESKKLVFYSIHNCDKHPAVPLMEIKYCTEKFLQDSCIN